MELNSSVDQIFEHLARLDLKIAKRRRQGASVSQIEEVFLSLHLDCPQDLIALYSLCDGTDTAAGEMLGETYFFPGYYWMKLSEALQVYQAISDDDRWRKSWFPIFGSGGGDFFAVVCDRVSSDFGCVVHFLRGEPDHLVEFQSVSKFFQVIEMSLAENFFFLKDGILSADFRKMVALSQTIQPGFVAHIA